MASEEKKLWTEKVKFIQEDLHLMSLVKIHGTKKWALISRALKEEHQVENKSGKQCRERWNNTLNPKLTDKPWTAQEERTLFEKQEKYGNKWSKIASFLKGRSDNSTKNHFYSILRKNLRRFNKHKPSDKQIDSKDIQGHLEDPDLRKILLKKPRHYHQRTTKKKKIETIDPAPKACPSVERRKSRLNELEIDTNSSNNKKPLISIRKPSTLLDLSEIQDSQQRSESLVCPTPVHKLYIDEPALTPVYNGLATISTKSSFYPNNGNNFNFFDVSPHADGKDFYFPRHYTRGLSLKSVDEEYFSRGDSRKSSHKEDFGRSNSRKNTFSNERMTFPLYSPKGDFDFYGTPRNNRN